MVICSGPRSLCMSILISLCWITMSAVKLLEDETLLWHHSCNIMRSVINSVRVQNILICFASFTWSRHTNRLPPPAPPPKPSVSRLSNLCFVSAEGPISLLHILCISWTSGNWLHIDVADQGACYTRPIVSFRKNEKWNRKWMCFISKIYIIIAQCNLYLRW